MEKIVTLEGELIAGLTTDDPRSHYGQPVFRAERMPDVGERLKILFELDVAEEVRVIWTDPDSGWILTYNPDSWGSTILAVHPDAGHWGRLEFEGGAYEDVFNLAEAMGITDPAEEQAFEVIFKAVEDERICAEGTIHLPGRVLGGFLG